MKITAIGFRNFAGATSQVAFHGGRTALIGPNGAGKTRILQAIRVALCGYDPELGKKGNAGLACGDPMVVTLELCDDAHPPKTLTIRREFHATEAGGMKETVSLLPNRGEKTKAAADARILKTLGSQTTAVDLGALLSATAGQRAAKLAELVGDQADVTADTFVSKLRTAGELPDAQTQEIANAWDAQETIAANLETSLKVLAGATSEAAAREKEATATVRRLEEEVSGLGAPAKALPELEAERDAAQARAGELRTEIGADTERGARLATLQSSTADAEAGLARWVTMTAAAVEELADTEKTLAAAMEEDADAKAIPEVKVPDPVPPAWWRRWSPWWPT